MSGWTKCSDTSPVDGQIVLCLGYNFNDPAKGFWHSPNVAKFIDGEYFPENFAESNWDTDSPLYATLWSPIPNMPQEQQ